MDSKSLYKVHWRDRKNSMHSVCNTLLSVSSLETILVRENYIHSNVGADISTEKQNWCLLVAYYGWMTQSHTENVCDLIFHDPKIEREHIFLVF